MQNDQSEDEIDTTVNSKNPKLEEFDKTIFPDINNNQSDQEKLQTVIFPIEDSQSCYSKDLETAKSDILDPDELARQMGLDPQKIQSPIEEGPSLESGKSGIISPEELEKNPKNVEKDTSASSTENPKKMDTWIRALVKNGNTS